MKTLLLLSLAGVGAYVTPGGPSVVQRRLAPLFSSTLEPPKVDAVAAGGKEGSGKAARKDRGSPGPLEVFVLGLSHHNAKVEVREKLAIPEAEWNDAATALCAYPAISS